MAKYKIIPSSRTIVHSPISIGHKAEKGVEAIEFDLTAWVETYGSGTLTVIMRRWGDAIPYPIALEIGEDNKATWTLSDIDTAKAGMAYAQLNYIVGDEVVKKSDIYTFRVMDSLTGEGEPPEAYESWLEHLTHLAAEAMAEVLDIEGIVTDKTLTVDGGIADAKATGEALAEKVDAADYSALSARVGANTIALAEKADRSTTYTKTQVDQMIADVEVETDTTLEVAGAPADAAETGRQIGLLKADLGAINTATSEDVGKALKVKTVTSGKVTEWEFGEAGSGDAEALEARVEAIENVEPTYLLEGVEWEFGTLSRGANSGTATNRLRTVGSIEVPEGMTVIPFALSNGVKIGVHSLTSANVFIADSGWQNAAEYSYSVPENCARIRITLQTSNGSSMPDTSESDNVHVDISPDFIKRFLALENALDSKYDKSETYSKEEVEDISGFHEMNLLDDIEWELGSLHRDSGAEVSSTTVIRTPYIPILTDNMWITASISANKFRMFFYNSEYVRVVDDISVSGENLLWFTTEYKIKNHKVPDGTNYIRFAIDGATDPSEGSTLTATGCGTTAMLNNEIGYTLGKPIIFDKHGMYNIPITDGTTEANVTYQAVSSLDRGTQGKVTKINLKAGDILVVMGTGWSQARDIYKVFDASTGVLIDYPNSSNRPKTKPHYLRYAVDTHVYLSPLIIYPYYAFIVEYGSVLYEKIAEMPGINASILDLNNARSTIYEMKMLKRPQYNGRTPAVFVHFSDIHSDTVNTKRIVDFITDSRVSSYIDDAICSGDIVHGTVADINPFDSVDGAENIICVPGNHDCGKGSGSATLQEVYDKLYTGKIDNWGVTQPEGGASSYLGYFYKDYTTQKLRVIFLDSNHGSAYITTQASWLAEVLESARIAGLSVMCVSHYFFNLETLEYVECGFTPGYHWVGGGFARIDDALVAAVETFITNGGDFVCWLGGHGHQDYVVTNAAGTQLEIGISCSNPSLDTGDDIREMGTKSQDCINVMSIDTYCKRISILRLGLDRSRLMVSKKHLCLDYANRSVIWSD